MNRVLRLSRRVGVRTLRPICHAHPLIARATFNALSSANLVAKYQPVPWLRAADADRGSATEARWRAIERALRHIRPPQTALDLGSQLGYFTFRLAEAGWQCLGVEASSSEYEAACLIQRATGIPGARFRKMYLDAASVHELPEADVVVFLSLWHHICRTHGIDDARFVLRSVLQRARKACFFETGQSDETYMAWSRQLPDMQPNPRAWVTQLLLECGARRVEPLGRFGTHLGSVQRELFVAYTGHTP